MRRNDESLDDSIENASDLSLLLGPETLRLLKSGVAITASGCKMAAKPRFLDLVAEYLDHESLLAVCE
jgi:hypothetical protein